MGRLRRLQFEGACYYLILRANNRQDLFASNQDRRQFLALLKIHKERCRARVYAYCLLEDSVHLVLETELANVAVFMQGLAGAYAKWFNAEHDSRGHLFQERYRSWVADKKLLAETTRHVHLLPLEGPFRGKPWRFQWSSCADYVHSPSSEILVDAEPVLSRFGRARLAQSVRYLHYLEQGLKNKTPLPRAGGLVIGDAAFLAAVRGASPVAVSREFPQDRGRDILAAVARETGVEESHILGRLRWREVCAARRKLVARLWQEGGSVTFISRFIGCTPSAVSQALRISGQGL